MPLEVLNLTFVIFRGGAGLERPQIPSLAGLWIFLAGVYSPDIQFSDHQVGPLIQRRKHSYLEKHSVAGHSFPTPILGGFGFLTIGTEG